MKYLTYEDIINLDIGEEFEGWKIIEEKPAGTWRWGTYDEYIVQHLETGKFYGCMVQKTGGDHAINEGLWKWEDTPKWYECRAVQTVTYEPI